MVPIIPEPAISIHAPSRERRTTFISTFYKLQFQSTLPRGSDDFPDKSRKDTKLISIHAPSRERRSCSFSPLWITTYFNPRSLAGATLSSALQANVARISIHAPSRERLHDLGVGDFVLIFQSTLPRGSDPYGPFLREVNILFQSTLPRGSDVIIFHKIDRNSNFNPRSLAGATGYNLFRSPTLEFQSTLPRGSDQETCVVVFACNNFNPRSLAGATCPMSLKLITIIFQSTLPRGSDQWAYQQSNAHQLISIHAPSRERQKKYILQDLH